MDTPPHHTHTRARAPTLFFFFSLFSSAKQPDVSFGWPASRINILPSITTISFSISVSDMQTNKTIAFTQDKWGEGDSMVCYHPHPTPTVSATSSQALICLCLSNRWCSPSKCAGVGKLENFSVVLIKFRIALYTCSCVPDIVDTCRKSKWDIWFKKLSVGATYCEQMHPLKPKHRKHFYHIGGLES